MSNNPFYEVPELEECPHGVRNEEDCAMCIEEKRRKKEEKEADK